MVGMDLGIVRLGKYFLCLVQENNISGFILSRRRTDETNNYIIKKASVTCSK